MKSVAAFFQRESNVTINPTATNCCARASATTPGEISAPRKNPPPAPRESATRYSTHAIVLVFQYGSWYSTVVVKALLEWFDFVHRPSRSHANSGRTVAPR